MIIACSPGPDRGTAPTEFEESISVQDTAHDLAESPRTPRVWITTRSTLETLLQASRDHALEPELPIKVNSAHVGFRNIELDTASVFCKSIDQKSDCWVARLELRDASGSRFWSISTYDTAFAYLGSLVVEERRASSSPKVMFLVGQIWYYGENFPLDYQVRIFDPEDSLTGHPDLYDAKNAVGYVICEDGSIRCCSVPANCFHRKSEMKFVVPDSCKGC
jgi:hypothetical protein